MSVNWINNYSSQLYKIFFGNPKSMKRSREKEQGRPEEPPDIISKLPNELLFKIISLLSTDEAVRSSILCKRWKSYWTSVSRLDFDEEHMKKLGNSQYGELVSSLLRRHGDDLSNCCFRHLTGDDGVANLVEFAVQKYKRLSSLTLECVKQNPSLDVKASIFSNLCSLELTNYTLSSSASSAFHGCEKLKSLKMKLIRVNDETLNGILKNSAGLEKLSLINLSVLKKLNIHTPSLKFLELQLLKVSDIDVFTENLEILVMENVTCPPKRLNIYALRLMAFHSSCNSKTRGILKTQDIIENCSDLLKPYNKINIFQFLSTLSIDLDLNNIRYEGAALAFVLRSCLYLKTLEINILVVKGSNSSHCAHFSCGPSDCSICEEWLKYNSMFWERSREIYNCILHQLKFATIKGFSGKEQEVKFVKHLITTSNQLRRISLICNSSKVAEMEEVAGLLSLPRASFRLTEVRKELSSLGYCIILQAQASLK